jgi:hypothetical protein
MVYPLSFSEQAPARASLLSNHDLCPRQAWTIVVRSRRQPSKKPGMVAGLFGWQGHVEYYGIFCSHARSKLLRVALIIEPRSLSKTGLDNRGSIQAPNKKIESTFQQILFSWQGHVESNHDLRFWRPLY